MSYANATIPLGVTGGIHSGTFLPAGRKQGGADPGVTTIVAPELVSTAASKLPLLLGIAAVGVLGFFVVRRIRRGRR